MDEIDRHIVSLMQGNARISVTELGKRIGLSTPAANERLKRLEERGVITGYRAVINPEKLGKHVTAFILYDTTRCEAFREFCRQQPSVMECHRLAGQYSYLVKVVTENVRTLETFIDESMAYGQPSSLINLSSPVPFKAVE
ncbi:Lrp/AsnC family transcriptional regulator [Exiguobacterium chiriqhucha]|uniref:AsnC family transcriptional regulator n=1 Tax=Exiguobacterium chiriqhucha RW-2 TaxID=1345023 RepID=U1M1E8_9BACL|nr:Lrp/AsnC family transcriptional regulator [Exiguobacterium chiriqhucha]ERG68537.1 AsnC family transcriptional regulator [Exiguobacterium chiriqhucha RW-2]